jgi:c-di-GMP-binding flagellar brake protein YcgR
MAIKFIRKMKSFDRRKYIRINLNCLVKYRVEASEKTTRHLTNLVNISIGGALLNTFEQKLEKNSKVELEFQLPNAENPVLVSGEIARTYPRRRGSYQAGVEFKGVGEKNLEFIKKYISSRLKSEKR